MMAWSEYIDESYNRRTLCVGGFLAPVDVWTDIENSWIQRIAYENRRSAKNGFPPISRYHATDCANLKREFDKTKGWDISRQIRLSKRLCEILVDNSPISAIVYGGSIRGISKYIEEPTKGKEYLYYTATCQHLGLVGELMEERFPNDRVTVYYDRSKQLGKIARDAFDAFMNDPSAKEISKYFLTMAPMGWEDCIPLQAADFIADEGMKRIDALLGGRDETRKALCALLGNTMPLMISHFTEQNFKDLIKIRENQLDGRPLNEGIGSKLTTCQVQ